MGLYISNTITKSFLRSSHGSIFYFSNDSLFEDSRSMTWKEKIEVPFQPPSQCLFNQFRMKTLFLTLVQSSHKKELHGIN